MIQATFQTKDCTSNDVWLTHIEIAVELCMSTDFHFWNCLPRVHNYLLTPFCATKIHPSHSILKMYWRKLLD